ncbi:MAG: ribonuclease HII [Rikenellaceae bacterium]
MLELTLGTNLIEAGCDEAGRGCLAGSLFGAAVILPADFHDPLLNDSKKLTPLRREKLRTIIEREAIAWSVVEISAQRVDEINVLRAAHESMALAVLNLDPQPQIAIIDGNLFKAELPIPHQCIVKGDGKYAHIAAASILAKTHRDEYMLALAEQYPQYDWASNKGYPTKRHRDAIAKYGLTPHHRLTFSTTK